MLTLDFGEWRIRPDSDFWVVLRRRVPKPSETRKGQGGGYRLVSCHARLEHALNTLLERLATGDPHVAGVRELLERIGEAQAEIVRVVREAGR